MRNLHLAILQYKHHIAFVLLLSLSLSLLFTEKNEYIDLVREKIIGTFSFVYYPVAWINNALFLEEENALLREKNLQLSLQIESMVHLAKENQRLENLLNFKRESQLTLVPAKVINKGITPGMMSMTIDVGTSSGIQKNNPVITSSGIVGKVHLASENSSIVHMLNDANFRLSVRIYPSGATGILQWVEGDNCIISEVLKNANIHVGDKVVTSGFSDIFPSKLPVGEVVGTTDVRGSYQKIVTVKCYSDLTSLINVFVITEQVK